LEKDEKEKEYYKEYKMTFILLIFLVQYLASHHHYVFGPAVHGHHVHAREKTTENRSGEHYRS
jgi:hypothetical protein